MRTYIAGPMRGIPLFNFPAFDEAAFDLLTAGYDPVNPADLDREAGFDPATLPADWDWTKLPEGLSQSDLFDRDMAALRGCDAIYMLPGWRRSTGATAECHAAKWLGLKIIIDDGPDEATRRKQMPVASGVLDYFPDAILALAHCSWVGNEQHNPGEPLHWSRDKSSDHADCAMRHFMGRGTVDSDGVRHSTKAAWRMLALLQLELETNR